MQPILHPASTRGAANHGWLKSFHTFSFADYFDPRRMQFGALRVLNDDTIAGGRGFGNHPHADMEIITIPLSGSLRHQDSMERDEIIHHGEVQIMSAGTGIYHSEMNASFNDPVSLLQIWVTPEKTRIQPRYEQKAFAKADRLNRLQTIISPTREDGSLWINQQAFFSLTDLEKGKKISYRSHRLGNGTYVFVISGVVDVNGQTLSPRDGAGFTEDLEITAHDGAELVLIEVPLNSQPIGH